MIPSLHTQAVVVAMSETHVVIGSPNIDGPVRTNEGYVYVFGHDGSSWSVVQTIEGTATQRGFGSCAALSANGWLVIGHRRAGLAEVWAWDNTTGSFEYNATLDGSSPDESNFGWDCDGSFVWDWWSAWFLDPERRFNVML